MNRPRWIPNSVFLCSHFQKETKIISIPSKLLKIPSVNNRMPGFMESSSFHIVFMRFLRASIWLLCSLRHGDTAARAVFTKTRGHCCTGCVRQDTGTLLHELCSPRQGDTVARAVPNKTRGHCCTTVLTKTRGHCCAGCAHQDTGILLHGCAHQDTGTLLHGCTHQDTGTLLRVFSSGTGMPMLMPNCSVGSVLRWRKYAIPIDMAAVVWRYSRYFEWLPNEVGCVWGGLEVSLQVMYWWVGPHTSPLAQPHSQLLY